MKEMITTRSARVQEIVEHIRAKRERRNQDKAWKRLAEIGIGRSPDMPAQDRVEGQPPYELLHESMWSGSRCFIVGGGESLRGFDFARLRGELVIAVNRAFEFCDADILFAMDPRVREYIMSGRFGNETKRRYENFPGLKIWLDAGVPGVYHLKNNGQEGLSSSLEDGLSTGGNSGYAAMNLAILLGANPIYLLGIDMKGDGKGNQAWFHSGYPENQKDRVYLDFMAYFNKIAPEIKRRGLKVINLNPESKLRCFPFEKFDDIKNIGAEPVYSSGALGFGDNFYQRSILRHLAKDYKTIYLETTCPEIYWDIPNIKFVNPGQTRLRTQNKHLVSYPRDFFSEKPAGINSLRWKYRPIFQRKDDLSHCEVLRQSAGMNIEDFDFSFPVKPEWIEAAKEVLADLDMQGKKLCIIRPSTIRREWFNPSRNPYPEYYQLLIDRHKDEYFFLSFADVEKSEEWLDGDLTGLDAIYHKGELPLTTIFGLIKISDMFITNPGLGMVLGIAERVKCFTIFGGEAKPGASIDDSMGLDNFSYVAPEPFCNCFKGDHKCNKEIPVGRIIEAFEELKNRPFFHDVLEITEADELPVIPIFPMMNKSIYNEETFLRLEERDKSEMARKLNEFRIGLVRNYVNGNDRTLDIGIGAGTFMGMHGNCLGFDINPHAINLLKRRGKWFDPYRDDFGSANIAAVTFFDSLEHIENPALILKRLTDQIVVVSLPIFRDKEHILSSKHFKPGEHYWHFTRNQFERYITAGCGFKIIEERDDETRLGREDIKTFVLKREENGSQEV